MILVGITGGIGSGKSTICNIFNILACPTYQSDSRAKALMVNSSVIRNKITSSFGENAYLSDGNINRKHLANIVFNCTASLKKLNNIVHPEVREDFKRWVSEQKSDLVIFESAILFENGFDKLLDKTINVSAPLDERIERVMKRDNISKEEVMARINNQTDEETRLNKADFIIYNGKQRLVINQVLEIKAILTNS